MNHRAARRAFALASQFRASKLSPRISAVFGVTETAEDRVPNVGVMGRFEMEAAIA